MVNYGNKVTGAFTVNGSQTINGASAAMVLAVNNTIANTGNGSVAVTEQTAASRALGIQVSGDSFVRILFLADGTISWGPGNAGRDVTLARTAAGILSVTAGSFSVTTAGQGLAVKEGSNAKQGTAVLAGGTVVVSNTSVTASSRIMLTTQSPGGAVGAPYVSARTPGTSFTITSTSGTDTSTVAYQIFEPA